MNNGRPPSGSRTRADDFGAFGGFDSFFGPTFGFGFSGFPGFAFRDPEDVFRDFFRNDPMADLMDEFFNDPFFGGINR